MRKLLIFLLMCSITWLSSSCLNLKEIKDTSELDKEGFVLTFNDGFDGHGLNEKFWHPNLPWDYNTANLNREEQGYVRENILVEDGLLKLRLEKKSIKALKNGEDAGFDYASGCISSKTKWIQKYGYFEIRAKLPGIDGTWPAFWMMPENDIIYKPVGAEIDIFEWVRELGDNLQFGIHWDGYGRDHKQWSRKVPSPEMSNGFHTYGLEWNPESLAFYIDGVKLVEYDGEAVPHSEHYIILNLAAGHWGGYIDDSSLPCDFEIDYVRAYQYEDMDSIIAMEEKALGDSENFEEISLRNIVKRAAKPVAESFIELTDYKGNVNRGEKRFVVDGSRSLLGNTIESESTFNEIYNSPLGQMEKGKAYNISFSYQILNRHSQKTAFYTMARSLNQRDEAPLFELLLPEGNQGLAEFIVETGSFADYYLTVGIQGKGMISIDNISIREIPIPEPPPVPQTIFTENFESATIEEISHIASNQLKDLQQELTLLTDNEEETIAGKLSLKGDSMEVKNQWNEIYHSPTSLLQPGQTYRVTFKYKILDITAGSNLYALVRSPSNFRAGIRPQLSWQSWSGNKGDEGEISLQFETGEKDDYYLIIGNMYNASVSIDELVLSLLADP